MIAPRTVTDIAGSTVASVAQFCAREILKSCERVRTTRTVGQFVVESGVVAVRKRLSTVVHPPSDDTGSPSTQDADVGATSTTTRTAAPSDAPPVSDYDLLTSAEVVELLDTLESRVVADVLEYEMGHRRRRLVVEAAQRLLRT